METDQAGSGVAIGNSGRPFTGGGEIQSMGLEVRDDYQFHRAD